MSTETTSAPKVTKLPAHVYYMDKNKNNLKLEIEKVLATLVDKGGIKDIKSHKKEEIAKRILISNFRSYPKVAEIPAEFEEIADTLESVNGMAAGVVKMHISVKEVEDEKEKTKKQQAAAEKEAEKLRKEEENKAYKAAEEEFEAAMISSMPKVEKNAKKITDAIISSIKMPSSVTIAANGMGLNVADNASKAEVATAIASSISILGSLKDAEGALQFQIGDAVNHAVKSGIYRKKGDAASHLKVVILEKCGKDYNVGHIQTCALMAERVSVEKRQRGISPSKYLIASKLTVPRVKDSTFNVEAAEQKTSEFRDELIEEINKGADSKSLAEKVKQFKVDNKFIKPPVEDNSAKIRKLQNRYVWASMLMELTVDDEVTTMRGKDKKTYTTAELVEIRDEAYAELQALMLGDEDNIKYLRKGMKGQEVKGEVKDLPYRLTDPLWEKEPKKDEKEEEPEQVPVEEVETSEEEEEEEIEGIEEVISEEEEEEEEEEEIDFNED